MHDRNELILKKWWEKKVCTGHELSHENDGSEEGEQRSWTVIFE